VFHRRAAARRIDDNRVHVFSFQTCDGAPREPSSFLLPAGVQRERAAAAQPTWHDHLAAFRGKDPQRGLIDLGKVHALHATGQQRHAPPARAARRAQRWQPCSELRPGEARRERLELPEACRQQSEYTRTAQQPAQAALLVQKLKEGEHTQARGVGEERKQKRAK